MISRETMDFKCCTSWLSGLARVWALLLVLGIAAQAQTVSGTTGSGLIYSASNGEITLTGYDDSGTSAVIPSTINVSGSDLPVTSIAASAFYNCTNLASVTIPASVISVGDDGLGAYPMTSITVDAANPVYSSLDGVFFDKTQTALLQYPESKPGSSYTIPGSVTRIGYDAFFCCLNLTSITIPDTVTSIGDYAFFQDWNLTDVNLPSSVISLGAGAFCQCTKLTSVTIPKPAEPVPRA